MKKELTELADTQNVIKKIGERIEVLRKLIDQSEDEIKRYELKLKALRAVLDNF